MISLEHVPNGVREIETYYGDPDPSGNMVGSETWRETYLERFELPWPMRLSWRPRTMVSGVLAHRFCGAAMMDALKEIGEMFEVGWIRANGLDWFGGIWNVRLKRGKAELSTHSWAIAIDLNPHKWAFGSDPNRMPVAWVHAFTRRGFVWGGEFEYPDPMHFQAAEGY